MVHMKTFADSFFRITVTALLTVSLFMLAVVWLPVAWGWQPYRVASNSMWPALRKNSIIMVRPIDTSELEEGDIITFQRPGKNIVTHRIVQIEDGLFITQGDANSAPDRQPVEPEWVIGKVVYHIPWFR